MPWVVPSAVVVPDLNREDDLNRLNSKWANAAVTTKGGLS